MAAKTHQNVHNVYYFETYLFIESVELFVKLSATGQLEVEDVAEAVVSLTREPSLEALEEAAVVNIGQRHAILAYFKTMPYYIT